MTRPKVRTYRDVIDRCGSPAHLAAAIGIEAVAVRKWRVRDRIPPEYWRAVLEVAEQMKQNITANDLVRVAEERVLRSANGGGGGRGMKEHRPSKGER